VRSGDLKNNPGKAARSEIMGLGCLSQGRIPVINNAEELQSPIAQDSFLS